MAATLLRGLRRLAAPALAGTATYARCEVSPDEQVVSPEERLRRQHAGRGGAEADEVRLAHVLQRRDALAQERAKQAERVRQLEKAARKARKLAQERVAHGETQILGVVPRQWLEVLDDQHRYGSLLHPYFGRWEASRTRMSFFQWLDEGRGALVDLPELPRRFLDEGKVCYLPRPMLPAFEVEIRDGCLHWCVDGALVTLPGPIPAAAWALVEPVLAPARRREALMDAARAAAEAAVAAGAESIDLATRERVLRPLVDEGLLKMLRDPLFAHREQACASDDDREQYERLWTRFQQENGRFALSDEIPAEATWGDVIGALDHDDGLLCRKRPLPRVRDRGRGGIFVMDHFGHLLAAQKIAGTLHHSSLTRGHACRFAGSIVVEEGRVTRISPHSGHFIPTRGEYDALLDELRGRGLDLSKTEIRGLVKEK